MTGERVERKESKIIGERGDTEEFDYRRYEI